jgi:N-acetylmuramoyl-L-alanine amidase
MLIVLDPGHGGKAPGAVGVLGSTRHRESDVALLIARRIKEPLARRHKVVWTRTSDENVTLKARVEIAEANNADAFISVHMNAGPAQARGCEIYYAEGDAESMRFATRILTRVAAIYPGFVSRGAKPDWKSQHKSLYVLQRQKGRRLAVLIEAAFISNKADLEMALGPQYGLALGEAILGALEAA